MIRLTNGWITQGLMDFEYKKYLLLGYIQWVKSEFNQVKLYPTFSELVDHYYELQNILDKKAALKEMFPKQLKDINLETNSFTYSSSINENDIMEQISEIAQFSLPIIQENLKEAKQIYDFVENNTKFSQIGLSGLDNQEGYLLLKTEQKPAIKVYEYHITFFENAHEKYRGLRVDYLETINKSTLYPYESIKIQLINKYHRLPNPTTYLIESKVEVPFDETFLPIAKRILVKNISK